MNTDTAAALGGGGLGALLMALFYWWRRRQRADEPVPMPTDEIRQILAEEFAGSPLPMWFVLTNASLESGFDNTAELQGPADDSHGLFMVNLKIPGLEERLEAEMGLDLPDDLYDARTNAKVWRDYGAGVFRRAAIARGMSGDRVWEAVRLRLGGIAWDKLDTHPKSARIKARFWERARRYRA